MRLIYAARRVSEATGSYDFIYSVTTLFAQLRLYLLRTFAKSSLNSELRFNQITPRLSFLIQDVTNAEPFIDALEIVTGELAAVVRDHVFPKSPTQQRLKVDV